MCTSDGTLLYIKVIIGLVCKINFCQADGFVSLQRKVVVLDLAQMLKFLSNKFPSGLL